MRVVTAVGMVLVCCTCAAGQCVELPSSELPRTQSSSRNAKITVLVNGKPQGNVKLTVSLPQRQGLRSFVSDSEGTAVIKNLPEGMSCVTATTENNLTDVLCLQVPNHSTGELSSFVMVLSPRPAHSFDDRVRRAEQSPQIMRLRKLAGTVVDENDALIQNADVQVYKGGKYPEGLVTTTKTNEFGHFEASLEPGTYTVIFRMFGFGSEVVEVEVSSNGSEEKVRRTLKVAATDYCGAND